MDAFTAHELAGQALIQLGDRQKAFDHLLAQELADGPDVSYFAFTFILLVLTAIY
jgi:hypothetical protein